MLSKYKKGLNLTIKAWIVSIVMTIVFPLRIVMSSVKHIVAAAQSWTGKERGRQQRVKLQSVEALTMTDDQGLLQFLFYPFSAHESEITNNVTN